jgi:hypothetical protein
LDCSFVCVAVFVVDASTVLPLFWLTAASPPPHGLHEDFPPPLLAIAMFGPLTTAMFEAQAWVAVFEPSFDCVADCDGDAVPIGGVSRSPAAAVPTPPASASARLITSVRIKRCICMSPFVDAS